ncbi:glycoside hydrolase family 3 N-terminal domain-containing protein [Gracilibacillus alcaliphilus]|uniref:glycoside hydrolase family 3 N-terminal domain-containing protein n=1 Tax=Gracilibacillus alcaliphilus TaxID=1401441 RepID=UPI00195E1194|nr:glycoside hydrolase family 3 N-terminal domain-containing protein [Gracilibacillus alcaliphilus]MBM7677421.1 beta-glucosidase [Gracilibacillus alcaliphilus]
MSKLQPLLDQMTLQEKIDQLVQLATPFFKGAKDAGEITGPMLSMNIKEGNIQNAGSVLGASGAANIRAIQAKHLEENRLNIPLLFMSDVVHGYKTIFPIPLAIGCSWNTDLAEESARIAAKESAVSGIHVTFAPMVDLVRDPRWGRVMESTGEDPYLNGEFAKAQVRGFQGDQLKESKEHVAACVKHFAAYGAAEGGRDYNTVNMSDRQLQEMYLPAYKAAIDEDCRMVMSSFNTVDGIPATANQHLMNGILRQEWGFDGVMISDWGAVKELIPHGVAADKAEAAAKALRAGTDIEMMTDCYTSHLQELVETGVIEESLIDQSVLRILQLKDDLGLFENPYRGADPELEKQIVLSEQHRKVAKQVALESCVLLKNEQVLPLTKTQKVALIGPFADSGDILGQWSWQGSKEDAVTLRQGFANQLQQEPFVAKGSEIEAITAAFVEEALIIGEQADVLVVALGEDATMSGEAGSLTDIQLPEAQLTLLENLATLNKPIVTVIFNGRPLDLHGVIEHSDAVVEAWFPGTEGGNALADLLYGEQNFSGKLTMSFPNRVGQIPVYYNHYNTGRPKDAADAQVRYVSQYLDSPNGPLFPFGYGLSYTTFSYQEPVLSTHQLTKDETLTITVKVKNTGHTSGKETVQLYVQDLVGEVVRPVKELKAFEKVSLQPGEEKEVQFTLTEAQLRYFHADMSYSSDPGSFKVLVGPNSQETASQLFTLV